MIGEIPVQWHYNSSFWDCAFPRALLNRAATCKHIEGLSPAAEGPIGVILVPGRHSTADHDALNLAAGHFDKVIFMIIGDEEGVFRADGLNHKRKIVWWFMPPYHPQQKVDRVCINGWPTNAPSMIAAQKEQFIGIRDFDWCFMGQVTHHRRFECLENARLIPHGAIAETDGFAKGLGREVYYEHMVRSKFALCPSGPCTPDSFRFAEALEAGCVPIVDDLTPDPTYPPGYWEYVLGPGLLPFPLIHDWRTLPQVLEFCLDTWKERQGRCIEWWHEKMTEWVLQLREDIRG